MNFKNLKLPPGALDVFSYAAVGDIGSAIAVYKFLEVRNLIAFANYSIELAEKSDDNVMKYHHYRTAILDYNACYDYILQIIYFGFDFCAPIYSKAEYIHQMEQCTLRYEDGVPVSQFAKDMDAMANSECEAAKNFIEELKTFKKALRKSNAIIQYWANNIKHHGGFVVEDLLDKPKLARITTIRTTDNITTFDSAFVYPMIATFDKIKNRLLKQNELILDFLLKLYRDIFGTPPTEFGVKTKIFSANKYNKEELKGNTYLQSFEPQE